MEYLIYAGFFVGGWLLSKSDSRKQWQTHVRKLAEQAFKAGAMFGYQETLKVIASDSPKNSTTVGFSVPTNVNKENDQ